VKGTLHSLLSICLVICTGCDCDEGGQELLDSGPLDAAADAPAGDGDADADADADTDADGDADADTDADADGDADCDEPDAGCVAWTCGGEFPDCAACLTCDPRPDGQPDACHDLSQNACEDGEDLGCEPVVVGACRGCPTDTYVACEATCERVSLEGCLLLSHCQVAQGDPDLCVRRDRRCDTADVDACYDRYTCRPYPDEPAVGVCVPSP
jgi:hypothetical protein